ncbi:formyltransferase family protein [Kitasatospora sp. NPDC094015]|uniref:formyltransferase family protein n=1 Tax=Kitasatospora sp. NPDC094015 TaxID=3155205 RepID=UPI003332CAE8
MIFVGRGALLHRAVGHALAEGHRVDLVVTDDRAADPPAAVPQLVTGDVNALAAELTARCSDGLVWSVNNRMIFRPPLLSAGLRILNLHNGLLPQHRGLPSAAVAYALLHGDREYGATLHEVDAGVDTGRVLAELRFPVGAEDRYHQVLLRGVRSCHLLFQQSVGRLAAGLEPGPPPVRPPARPGYYGLRALRELPSYAGHPAFARATDLGVAAPFVPELVEALRTAPAAGPAGGAIRTIDETSHKGVTDG